MVLIAFIYLIVLIVASERALGPGADMLLDPAKPGAAL